MRWLEADRDAWQQHAEEQKRLLDMQWLQSDPESDGRDELEEEKASDAQLQRAEWLKRAMLGLPTVGLGV